MSVVDSGIDELPVQIVGDCQIREAMISSTPNALDADSERRQQDHIVHIGRLCRVNECRQEPWPDDALKNDEGNLAQPTGRGCCGLDDHFVLTARLRQPRQNVSLLDHGEEGVTRHKRARSAHGRQLASHRGLPGPRRSRYDDQFAHCSIVLDPCCGGASND